MKILEGIIEILKVSILNGNMFLFISTIIMVLTGLAIWFLVVMNVNINIAKIRKKKSMKAVDQTIISIKGIMKNHYNKLAAEYLEGNWLSCMEVKLTDYLYNEVLEYRKICYNGRIDDDKFEDKDSREWRDFKNDCIREDFESIREHINSNYHQDCIIPRIHTQETKEKWPNLDDLETWNQKILPEIKDLLDELFDYFLEVAKDNKYRRFFYKKILIGVA